MDFERQQIQKEYLYLWNNTQNIDGLISIMAEEGLLTYRQRFQLLLKPDELIRCGALYRMLLDQTNINLSRLRECLLLSGNEHVVRIFEPPGHSSGEETPLPPLELPLSKKMKPKPPTFSADELRAASLVEGELPNILYCLIGTNTNFELFHGLPSTASCLTTIKLQNVFIEPSNFSDCFKSCVNLEFLQLDRIRVFGCFSADDWSSDKVLLPKLTDFFYNEVRQSDEDLEAIMESTISNDNDWKKYLFFEKEASSIGPELCLEDLWGQNINIRITVKDRELLLVDHDKSRLMCHSTDGAELLPKIQALSSLSLYEANLFLWSDQIFPSHLRELNLCQIQNFPTNFLDSCPSLKNLTITKCPELILNIADLPLTLENLSLNIGLLKYTEGISFELDTLALYNTAIDKEMSDNFVQIFKFNRLGLGGDLVGLSLVPLLTKLLTAVSSHSLNWLFLWEINWGLNQCGEREMLDMLGINPISAQISGFLYEYLDGNMIGVDVSDGDSVQYIQGLLGWEEFWSGRGIMGIHDDYDY